MRRRSRRRQGVPNEANARTSGQSTWLPRDRVPAAGVEHADDLLPSRLRHAARLRPFPGGPDECLEPDDDVELIDVDFTGALERPLRRVLGLHVVGLAMLGRGSVRCLNACFERGLVGRGLRLVRGFEADAPEPRQAPVLPAQLRLGQQRMIDRDGALDVKQPAAGHTGEETPDGAQARLDVRLGIERREERERPPAPKPVAHGGVVDADLQAEGVGAHEVPERVELHAPMRVLSFHRVGGRDACGQLAVREGGVRESPRVAARRVHVGTERRAQALLDRGGVPRGVRKGEAEGLHVREVGLVPLERDRVEERPRERDGHVIVVAHGHVRHARHRRGRHIERNALECGHVEPCTEQTARPVDASLRQRADERDQNHDASDGQEDAHGARRSCDDRSMRRGTRRPWRLRWRRRKDLGRPAEATRERDAGERRRGKQRAAVRALHVHADSYSAAPALSKSSLTNPRHPTSAPLSSPQINELSLKNTVSNAVPLPP